MISGPPVFGARSSQLKMSSVSKEGTRAILHLLNTGLGKTVILLPLLDKNHWATRAVDTFTSVSGVKQGRIIRGLIVCWPEKLHLMCDHPYSAERMMRMRRCCWPLANSQHMWQPVESSLVSECLSVYWLWPEYQGWTHDRAQQCYRNLCAQIRFCLLWVCIHIFRLLKAVGLSDVHIHLQQWGWTQGPRRSFQLPCSSFILASHYKVNEEL